MSVATTVKYPEEEQEQEEIASHELDFSLVSKVNLAQQQNEIPLLETLTFKNNTQEDIKNVCITLAADLAFLQEKQWRIERIKAGGIFTPKQKDVTLIRSFLANCEETLRTTLQVIVTSDSRILLTEERPVEVLPADVWGGMGHFPELTAAFCRPNDSSVEKILKKAAGILKSLGKGIILNGYNAEDKRNVYTQISSIYSAIAGYGIDYTNPPANFEYEGQRVRSPSQILKSGLGTCFDLSLLMAACLEQCGLNPIILFGQEHSLVGCWLVEDDFSAVVVDDLQSIRKREQLKELVLIETTLLTSSHVPAFKNAVHQGAKHLLQDDTFECAVDIKRARMSHIRPVSDKDHTVVKMVDVARNTDTVNSAFAEHLMPSLEDAYELADIEIVESEEKPSTPEERIEHWKLKLLDLSKRNRLLNYKPGKQAVPIFCPEPAALEDRLAADERLKLVSMLQLMDGSDPRSQLLFEERHGKEAKVEYAISALSKKDLLVDLQEQEMYARLVGLYRKARHDLEEGGANTLFVVIGFLTWKESETSDRSWKAPLILLPVTLERKSVQSGFRLIMRDEDPIFNPTLLEMLRQDFNLTIPLLEEDLPTDHSGLDIPKILQIVRHSVRDIRGWEVTEDVILSTFSFSKHLMWKDLQDNSDLLKENPVVKHLIDDPQSPYRDQGNFPHPDKLDNRYSPIDTFCPLSADGYQMAAIYAAAEGKDFVLVGPPGTGKSQTIANMVIQMMAMGRTVLFVSEKMAALDVVYRRLKDVGFGDFCLELHSSKANKKSVLAQLGNAWDSANRAVQAENWEDVARRIAVLRTQLNEYPVRLHRQYRNGLTPYKALSRVIGEKAKTFVSFAWTETGRHDSTELDIIRDLTRKLKVAATDIGIVAENPFTSIVRGEWSPLWQEKFEQMVRKLISQIIDYKEKLESVLDALSLQNLQTSSREQNDALYALVKLLQQVENRQLAFTFSPDVKEIKSALVQASTITNEYNSEKKEFSCKYKGDALEVNATQLGQIWEEARNIVADNSETDLVGILDILQPQRPEDEDKTLVQALEKTIDQVESAIRCGTAWLAAKNALSCTYKNDGADIEMDTLCINWEASKTSWWPKSAIHYNAAIKILRQASEEGSVPSKDALISDIKPLMDMHQEAKKLNEFAIYAKVFQGVWDGTSTDWEHVSLLAEGLKKALYVLKSLSEASMEIEKPHHTRITEDLIHIKKLQDKVAAFLPLDKLGRQLGDIWKQHNSDWKAIRGYLVWEREAATNVSRLAGESMDALLGIRQKLYRLLSEGRDLLQQNSALYKKLDAFATSYTELNQCKNVLHAHVVVEEKHLGQNWIDATEKELNEWLDNIPQLRRWCAWKSLRDEAISHDLLPIIEAYESGRIAASEIPTTFERSYCRWWLTRVLSEDEVLRNFSGSEHERIINDFRKLDDMYLDLTKLYIKMKLSGDTPNRNTPSSQNRGSEWGVLNRELEKKTRQKPLRELISQLPNALTNLSPCLLMSPLSVAQYLSASGRKFDVVIFDEASQIPVWDAIGAIARGRQTIVVGDPKQLPPTTFFNRKSESDATEQDIIEDLESILDECLAANLPRLQLNWHYRSRHESLITFSNYHYYQGNLRTFPSAETKDTAVSYTYVPEGIYERGSSQINRPEGRAVVQEALKWLRDPEFVKNGWSLGIVTFNQKQREFIEDLLDLERRNDPELEEHFSDNRLEPVFVKNLENVQGDERDIIIFSLTFGPDHVGKFSMNFGPLNRDGGERRLNVAITRAKYALRVFGTFKPDEIDLSRTGAKGVEDLKHFLEFAEKGRNALAEAVSAPGERFDSEFEEEVASSLKKKGWRIHGQIGVSGYRVDLGVVHPDSPGKYIAGIECDGATYHSSATARDRDKLREQILRSLGWEILRVWSTDWWFNRQACLEKLDAALHSILEQDRQSAEAVQKNSEDSENYNALSPPTLIPA